MIAGAVALVGAGPGDADLLTLRAEDLLAEACVVIVDSTLERLARRFAPHAHVVAAPDGRAAPDLVLSAAANAHGPVVRLYRGDPWLHPAYQAEQAALEAANRPTEAVAGVAVEVAVPALAGVAVHVRRLAVACTLGPFMALPPACDPARTLVASGDDTAAMAREVAAAGDRSLPAALVPVAAPAARWQGVLGDVIEPAAVLTSPALLVVGAVCAPTGPHPAPKATENRAATGSPAELW